MVAQWLLSGCAVTVCKCLRMPVSGFALAHASCESERCVFKCADVCHGTQHNVFGTKTPAATHDEAHRWKRKRRINTWLK
eukprot:7263077-Alexandrium_andersonii.AAC.1